MTKEQLIEAAKHYFDSNKDIEVMYAFADGNFFYPWSKNDADNHARGKKVEMMTISKNDLKKTKSSGKSKDKPVEEVKLDDVTANSKPKDKKKGK